jgi:thiol peroxidase
MAEIAFRGNPIHTIGVLPKVGSFVRKFNVEATNLENTVVLCVSRDLPFAQQRFCAAEGLDKVVMGSEFQDSNFSDAYGIRLKDGPLRGLFSRAIVIVDEQGKVIYTEQVPEITQEPDYDKALKAVKVGTANV